MQTLRRKQQFDSQLEQAILVDRFGLPVSAELQFAVAHLLWETAHIDGYLHPLEQMEILFSLKKCFHLTSSELRRLHTAVGEVLGDERMLRDNLQMITGAYSPLQRKHVFSLICRIALADRFVHRNESLLATLLCDQLDLNSESVAA